MFYSPDKINNYNSLCSLSLNISIYSFVIFFLKSRYTDGEAREITDRSDS